MPTYTFDNNKYYPTIRTVEEKDYTDYYAKVSVYDSGGTEIHRDDATIYDPPNGAVEYDLDGMPYVPDGDYTADFDIYDSSDTLVETVPSTPIDITINPGNDRHRESDGTRKNPYPEVFSDRFIGDRGDITIVNMDEADIADTGADPTANGEITNNAGSLRVQSGDLVKSLDDIKAYGQQSLQQQVFTGLLADSTGEKAATRNLQEVPSAFVNAADSAYLVGVIDVTTMGGSADIQLELYDETGATADIALETVSVSGTGYQVFGASTDILGSLTAGNNYSARWNVTTASATAGDDFAAIDARIRYE